MTLEEFAREDKLQPVKRFTMLHPGWECDQHGLLVQDEKGEHHVILTNHGSPYLANRGEILSQVSSLQGWLKDVEEVAGLLNSDPVVDTGAARRQRRERRRRTRS